MQDLMNIFTFKPNKSRFLLHGQQLNPSHGLIVSQTSVTDRPDSSGTAGEEAADRRFDIGRGITSEFPADFTGLVSEADEQRTRLTHRHSACTDCQDTLNDRRINDHTPLYG